MSNRQTSEDLTSEELEDGQGFVVGEYPANRRAMMSTIELNRKPGMWLPLWLEVLEASGCEQGVEIPLAGNGKQRALKALNAYAEEEGMRLEHVRMQDGTTFIQVTS